MDYTTQNLKFKIKKLLRYFRLYGLRRTLIKVKGQYHMKKKFNELPSLDTQSEDRRHVGVIGCGNYSFSNIAYYLKKNYGQVIRGAMDIDINRAVSLFEEYSLQYYTDDPDKIINDPLIDIIYIASNHASHADYAIKALNAGKDVHIEKPHVVTSDQLNRLCSSMSDAGGHVSLGFNRPTSRIGNAIKQALSSQSGPAMLNWFVAGHEISPDHWYFKEEEGGRILGNLCHWTDFVYHMIPESDRYPIRIIPTRDVKSDCDIAVSYVFGDGSISVITFSAKGHTFEGVRERFAAHRGNILISMDDFKRLVIEDVDKKTIISPIFRDHGHEDNICLSYELSQKKKEPIYRNQIKYVWETGDLFLKTKEALEKNETIVVEQFDMVNIS